MTSEKERMKGEKLWTDFDTEKFCEVGPNVAAEIAAK